MWRRLRHREALTSPGLGGSGQARGAPSRAGGPGPGLRSGLRAVVPVTTLVSAAAPRAGDCRVTDSVRASVRERLPACATRPWAPAESLGLGLLHTLQPQAPRASALQGLGRSHCPTGRLSSAGGQRSRGPTEDLQPRPRPGSRLSPASSPQTSLLSSLPGCISGTFSSARPCSARVNVAGWSHVGTTSPLKINTRPLTDNVPF